MINELNARLEVVEDILAVETHPELRAEYEKERKSIKDKIKKLKGA